ncbi:hypothetical protein [Paenibacillus medicaginis]|uniref:Uncharacterized protein n=1 Tax=Paenibacillus medicaginis TaxID=1470560 RepID=A0ABV5BUU4_9BACL
MDHSKLLLIHMARTVWELTDVLVECFSNVVGTEDEKLLHDDKYVTKTLKQHLGSKEFKEFDAMNESEWEDAWFKFEVKTNLRR